MINATHLHPALGVGLAGVLVVCVAADLRWRRIPNLVTGPAMIAGAALNCGLHGVHGLLSAVAGLLLGLLILTPPFALGGIGGGDVKMMGAAGTFLGPALVSLGLAAGLALGGLLAAAVAAHRGRLGETLRRTASMVVAAVLARSMAPLRQPTTLPGRILLPYSVPLALGTVAAMGWAVVA
jgi:prepilin peptidase CpaA